MRTPDVSVDRELSWEELRKRAEYLNIPAWKLAEDLAVHFDEDKSRFVLVDF